MVCFVKNIIMFILPFLSMKWVQYFFENEPDQSPTNLTVHTTKNKTLLVQNNSIDNVFLFIIIWLHYKKRRKRYKRSSFVFI